MQLEHGEIDEGREHPRILQAFARATSVLGKLQGLIGGVVGVVVTVASALDMKNLLHGEGTVLERGAFEFDLI